MRKRWIVASVVAMLAIGSVVAVAVVIRVDTGKWRVPEVADFVRIARRVTQSPSRTIYLARPPIDLRPGEDDAASGLSSVLASGKNKPVRTRGFTGGDARWKQLVGCVARQFAPFDIAVTDRRPSDEDFVMVAVGGAPGDIGVKEHDVAGLAPFNGGVIPRAVVFAFTGATGNDVEIACETIAMEVGHTFGLDHEYLCRDVMTYLRGCGAKAFVDADAPCGESKQRPCESGARTQNSYRQLLRVLGPHPH